MQKEFVDCFIINMNLKLNEMKKMNLQSILLVMQGMVIILLIFIIVNINKQQKRVDALIEDVESISGFDPTSLDEKIDNNTSHIISVVEQYGFEIQQTVNRIDFDLKVK